MRSSLFLLCMHVIALAGVSFSYNTGFLYSAIPNMCTMLYVQFDLCLLKSVVYSCVSLQILYVFPRAFICCIVWSIAMFMCVLSVCPCCRSSLIRSFTILLIILFVVVVLLFIVCLISWCLLILMLVLPIHVCYPFTYAETCFICVVLFVCVHICCCFVVARSARALCQKPLRRLPQSTERLLYASRLTAPWFSAYEAMHAMRFMRLDWQLHGFRHMNL